MRPAPADRRVAACVVALALAAGLAGVARAQAIGRGFELERAGQPAQAAAVYENTLRADPANLPALLGLERVLPSLGRLPDLLALLRRAIAADGGNPALRGLLLRTFVGLNAPDSAAAVALRWAEDAPRDDAPFREWAGALEQHRRFDAARSVLLMGRRVLGRATALAPELAGLLQRAGEWDGAAREWAAAVSAAPTQFAVAVTRLAETPGPERERVVGTLTGPEASVPSRRIAAELLLGWGDPVRAWAMLEGTLGAVSPTPETVSALRRFADLANAPGASRDTRRVRGLVLARLAGLAPPALASRLRAEAARTLLEAGDPAAARAVLEAIAGDPAASVEAQGLAEAALVRVLIEEGRLDAAAARLGAMEDRLAGEDRATLRLALARARVRQGELARADSALAGDSSVDAAALRGWIALYRGELREAATWFRTAGPYAGERSEATERTVMLALLQRIAEPRLPALGAALLLLARGDSAAAVTGLRRAADGLPVDGGRPDVLLVAGQVAARLEGEAQARAAAGLFAEIVRIGGEGAAPPAAELEWARLLLRQGQSTEAIAHLEHLILSYPASAVVPEARRELERVRGAIPKS